MNYETIAKASEYGIDYYRRRIQAHPSGWMPADLHEKFLGWRFENCVLQDEHAATVREVAKLVDRGSGSLVLSDVLKALPAVVYRNTDDHFVKGVLTYLVHQHPAISYMAARDGVHPIFYRGEAFEAYTPPTHWALDALTAVFQGAQ